MPITYPQIAKYIAAGATTAADILAAIQVDLSFFEDQALPLTARQVAIALRKAGKTPEESETVFVPTLRAVASRSPAIAKPMYEDMVDRLQAVNVKDPLFQEALSRHAASPLEREVIAGLLALFPLYTPTEAEIQQAIDEKVSEVEAEKLRADKGAVKQAAIDEKEAEARAAHQWLNEAEASFANLSPAMTLEEYQEAAAAIAATPDGIYPPPAPEPV